MRIVREACPIILISLSGCSLPPLVQMPPGRFQAIGTVGLMTEKDVRPTCRNNEAAACAIGLLVVMPDPCDYPDDRYAALECHELAHALKQWKHETK